MEGKPLAFLVISAIVVAVVVFLCGVMVGRGVRSRTLDPVEVAAAAAVDPTGAPALIEEIPDPEGTSVPEEELTFPSRLQAPSAPDAFDEPLTPAREPRKPEPSASAPPAPRAQPPREPSGKGYVVQVMSLTKQPAAQKVKQSLESKGYSAFVSELAGMYRVRVGVFATHDEAVDAAKRLEKEEQYKKPWVLPN